MSTSEKTNRDTTDSKKSGKKAKQQKNEENEPKPETKESKKSTEETKITTEKALAKAEAKEVAKKEDSKEENVVKEPELPPEPKMTPLERFKKMDEHLISLKDLYAKLHTDPVKGLTHEEAEARYQRDGQNAIRSEEADRPWWRNNYKEIIVTVVFGGIFLKYVAWWMVAIIMGGTSLMFYFASLGNEWKELGPEAIVMRNGEWQEVEPGRVVVGDILRLRTGDVACADVRLFENNGVKIQVENLVNSKNVYERALECDKKDIIQNRAMVFGGANIVEGHGSGVVVSIGEKTVHGVVRAVRKEKEAKAKIEKKEKKSGEKEKTD